jgi:hypothetical protein
MGLLYGVGPDSEVLPVKVNSSGQMTFPFHSVYRFRMEINPLVAGTNNAYEPPQTRYRVIQFLNLYYSGTPTGSTTLLTYIMNAALTSALALMHRVPGPTPNIGYWLTAPLIISPDERLRVGVTSAVAGDTVNLWGIGYFLDL